MSFDRDKTLSAMDRVWPDSTFPSQWVLRLAERVQRLYRRNIRKGYESAAVLLSPEMYDRAVLEFRCAPYGMYLHGLPVQIHPASPGLAVTKLRRVSFRQ